MMSKEGSSRGGSPWTDAERKKLRQVLELRRLRSEQKMPQATNHGAEYSKLVYKAGLADGAWYRGYPGARSHEFVLILANPSKETLHKAYNAEIDLQGKFMLASFDFQFRYSPLSDQDKADLTEKGYKWVPPPVENGPPSNPL